MDLLLNSGKFPTFLEKLGNQRHKTKFDFSKVTEALRQADGTRQERLEPSTADAQEEEMVRSWSRTSQDCKKLHK